MTWSAAVPGKSATFSRRPALANVLALVSRCGRRMRQCWRALAIASWIAVGLLLLLLLVVLQRLKKPLLPATQCLRPLMMPWMQVAGHLLGVRSSVAGQRPAPGSLLLCNHISWLDIVVIAAQLPVRFVAKAEVRRWPLLGLLAAAAGTLFLQRGKCAGEHGSTAVAAAIEQALAAGEVVLIFPEGTTGDGRTLRRFHSKLIPASAAVVPLALAYRGHGAAAVPFLGDDDIASSIWRVLAERDVHAHLQLLATLTDQAAPGQARAAQARAAKQAVAEALGLASGRSVSASAVVDERR